MQKSGNFIKIKRAILNVGFLSAIAIMPTNLMAAMPLLPEEGFVTPDLVTCMDRNECAAANCNGFGGYCCPTGKTVTEYTCPNGCAWSTINNTCECNTVSGLTDGTGTYTGSSCTTAYTSSQEITCFSYVFQTTGDAKCMQCMSYN